jgi:two-component sensor histidine kinase
MANTKTTQQIEELANEVANLSEEISALKYLLKSDLTQWNIAEAIENLSFELKRYNDGKGYEYKKF